MLARKQQRQPETDESADAWVDTLRAVSVFEDLKAQKGALEALASAMQMRSFQPGAAILTEGETGTELFILVEGQASVYKSTAEGDHYKVAILNGTTHPFFGEGGLLDSDARSATIKADTPSRCLVLGREGFTAFGKANPEWALPVVYRIARAVMARLRKTNNDMTLLYNALVAEIRGS